MTLQLTAEKARIFRITHIDNVPWILRNGIYCRNSDVMDPNFLIIGNEDLISKRASRTVPIIPNGQLSDYIPFYFIPFSPMMYNIKTGYNGIKKLPNSKIAILVSSLNSLAESGHLFVFTDRHAYLRTARFFNQVADLSEIDWPLLQSRDFRRDPDDPDKFARYEAEALVHQHLPIDKLAGIVCYGENERRTILTAAEDANVQIQVAARSGWYF